MYVPGFLEWFAGRDLILLLLKRTRTYVLPEYVYGLSSQLSVFYLNEKRTVYFHI
jgi:hypothetical protein